MNTCYASFPYETVMKNLCATFQAWRERRKQKHLERWARTRAKGKARFVIRTMIIYGGGMTLWFALTDYLFHRGFRYLLFTVIYFSIVSPILSFVAWWSNEGKYTSAKLDARMKSIPRD